MAEVAVLRRKVLSAKNCPQCKDMMPCEVEDDPLTCRGRSYTGFFPVACFLASAMLLSPMLFTTTLIVVLNPAVQCDNGNWSLWRKCIYQSETPSPFDICERISEAPTFVHLARCGLVLLLILRSLEVLSMLIFCHFKSWTARFLKVFLELFTGTYIASTTVLFHSMYRTFMEDELTGCHINDSYWIQTWPYISITVQFLIAFSWMTYMTACLNINDGKVDEDNKCMMTDNDKWKTLDDGICNCGLRIVGAPVDSNQVLTPVGKVEVGFNVLELSAVHNLYTGEIIGYHVDTTPVVGSEEQSTMVPSSEVDDSDDEGESIFNYSVVLKENERFEFSVEFVDDSSQDGDVEEEKGCV